MTHLLDSSISSVHMKESWIDSQSRDHAIHKSLQACS
jgi:hypothetical protein